MTGKPNPDGYHAITPYLLVENVPELVEYLEEVFDAQVKLNLKRTNGSVMHVELSIGDSVVLMGEANENFAPMPGMLFVYVDDCDAVYEKAISAGGESIMVPTHMYHAGERYGGVKDPAGNVWWISTHVEDVSPDEQTRRIKELGL